jgi:N-acetylglucosaminyl-diphospho-decaprenol L-rhamnosyltransferase
MSMFTVVVVNWNARDLTLACLRSLAEQTYSAKIVCVDNNSEDGSADAIAAEFPEVALIRSGRNLGFAGGNNLALRTVTTDWVVLLNNDAEVGPDFLTNLAAAADTAAPDVGALTARVLLAEPVDGVVLVNSTGNQVRTDGYGQDRGWLEPADAHHPGPDVFGFCGAAAALRTSALGEVGLFDEDFFLYYEDSDLSWRLRRAGWRVEYCGEAVAHHHHSASTVEGSRTFRFHNERNRLLLLTKNATVKRAVYGWWLYVLKTGYVALFRRQPLTITTTKIRAFASAVRLLPRMLAKRRRIAATATCTAAEVEQLLTPPTATLASQLRGDLNARTRNRRCRFHWFQLRISDCDDSTRSIGNGA